MNINSIPNRSEFLTEKTNSSSNNLDLLSTKEICEIFSKEDLEPQRSVSEAMPEIVKAIDLILLRLQNKGKLFYIGAGTAGRLGVLDAAECPPTFCSDPLMIQALIAGGQKSLLNSSESLEDSQTLSILQEL